MPSEIKAAHIGPCRFCLRRIIITVMDENEKFSVAHDPPECQPFLDAMGRPPDRKVTATIIAPVDELKTKGDA